MRAQKIGKRAPFFDFADADEVLVKLEEETNELKTAITSGDKADIDEEFGDLLFTAVSLARKLGIDAEESLTKASEKFIGRFAVLEAEVIAEDKDITALSMAELDAIWDRIKHQSNN
jgi:tetrapyrrole methylase family protein/MazG family protein